MDGYSRVQVLNLSSNDYGNTLRAKSVTPAVLLVNMNGVIVAAEGIMANVLVDIRVGFDGSVQIVGRRSQLNLPLTDFFNTGSLLASRPTFRFDVSGSAQLCAMFPSLPPGFNERGLELGRITRRRTIIVEVAPDAAGSTLNVRCDKAGTNRTFNYINPNHPGPGSLLYLDCVPGVGVYADRYDKTVLGPSDLSNIVVSGNASPAITSSTYGGRIEPDESTPWVEARAVPASTAGSTVYLTNVAPSTSFYYRQPVTAQVNITVGARNQSFNVRENRWYRFNVRTEADAQLFSTEIIGTIHDVSADLATFYTSAKHMAVYEDNIYELPASDDHALHFSTRNVPADFPVNVSAENSGYVYHDTSVLGRVGTRVCTGINVNELYPNKIYSCTYLTSIDTAGDVYRATAVPLVAVRSSPPEQSVSQLDLRFMPNNSVVQISNSVLDIAILDIGETYRQSSFRSFFLSGGRGNTVILSFFDGPSAFGYRKYVPLRMLAGNVYRVVFTDYDQVSITANPVAPPPALPSIAGAIALSSIGTASIASYGATGLLEL